MELIRRLGGRKAKIGKSTSYFGWFWCPFCIRVVTKQMNHGRNCLSCGCGRHGDSNENCKYYKLYQLWTSMKRRCCNPNTKDYHRYGERGITVCEEWRHSYLAFKEWGFTKWRPDLVIDRIDNDGNYCPENCRFITKAESNKNRSTTKLTWKNIHGIRAKWKTGLYSLRSMAIEYKVWPTTIYKIVNNKTWKEKYE